MAAYAQIQLAQGESAILDTGLGINAYVIKGGTVTITLERWEAMTSDQRSSWILVSSLTNEQLRDDPLDVTGGTGGGSGGTQLDPLYVIDSVAERRNGGNRDSATLTLTSGGDHDIISGGAPGDVITVLWVSIQPDPAEPVSNLVQVQLLDGAGALLKTPYNLYFVGHWEPFDIPSDGTVRIVTENSGKVAVTVHYDVTTP